ncbi:hypothetical protein [Tsukamurella soli]|uniref:hypothetical protein n=1 Tax=Tsukamurella soli TaxID=644556 RepID=UPI00360B52D7
MLSRLIADDVYGKDGLKHGRGDAVEPRQRDRRVDRGTYTDVVALVRIGPFPCVAEKSIVADLVGVVESLLAIERRHDRQRRAQFGRFADPALTVDELEGVPVESEVLLEGESGDRVPLVDGGIREKVEHLDAERALGRRVKLSGGHRLTLLQAPDQ